MKKLLHGEPYHVKRANFKRSREIETSTSTLIMAFQSLFLHSFPTKIEAYKEAKQPVINRKLLHFKLYENNNSIQFDGVAHPIGINEILKTIVKISEGYNPRGGLLIRGGIDNLYLSLFNLPNAQAVVLSAGVIAGTIIWIIITAFREKLLEVFSEWIIGEYILFIFKIIIEILWIIFYYGYNRVKNSFLSLRGKNLKQIYDIIKEAKKT